MEVMEIFPERDQRLDPSIRERDTFVEDKVSNARGVGDDCSEVLVAEASTLR
jgi:hypothetical protein